MANQTTMQRILLAPGTDLSFLHEKPTDWTPKCASGLARHQVLLEKLVRYGWSRGWTVELPVVPKDSYGDRGVDIIINGSPIDIKSTGLTAKCQKWASRTINSTAYAGTEWKDDYLTEWMIFGTPGSSVETWEVALYKHMKKSSQKPPGAPYFWNNEVMPFSDLARIFDSRNSWKNQSTNWHNGACVTA